MIFPDIPSEHSPRPDTGAVMVTSTWACTPQIEEETCQVEQWLVHEIASEASGKGKDARDPIEDTGLSYAGIAATPLVLTLVSRGDDMKEVGLVFRVGWDGEGVDINIRMRRCSVCLEAVGSQKSRVVMCTVYFVSTN